MKINLTLPPEKLKTIAIMAGILVALALPLMFLLEDFVRDAIIMPLSYYAWYFGVILDALPQSLLIGVLVLLSIYLAVISLRRKQSTVWKPQTVRRQSPGSVQLWAERLSMVSQGTYSRERFEHQFGQLLMRLLAHDERLSLRATVRLVQAGELNVTPELQQYLRRALNPGTVGHRKFLDWLKDRLSRKPSQEEVLRQVTQDIEPALRYLERQLRLTQGEELDE